MIPTFNGTKSLKIDFQSVQYGMMHFTLTLGEKSFETRFSEVYDPILNFRKWLEAICIGVEQCSFSFDTEGKDIKFDLERLTYDREVFTVKQPYDDGEIFLSDYVDRKQLVEAFYFGLLNFRNSPKFEKYQWESDVFAEHLTNLLKLDYEILLTDLSKLGRKQLNDWLCKANPRYWHSTSTESEEADLAILLKTELSSNKKGFDRKTDRSEIEWNIPLDYSNWNIDEKRKLVEECLSENCSWHEGTKIEDFKSKIIEDYLNQTPEPKKVNGSI